MWDQHWDNQIGQRNKVESPERDPHIYRSWIPKRGGIKNGGKDKRFNK